MQPSDSSDFLQILLVEDNLADKRLLEETLCETNEAAYKLSHVIRLNEAEKIISTQTFDIILLDLNLPDGNGLANISRSTFVAR